MPYTLCVGALFTPALLCSSTALFGRMHPRHEFLCGHTQGVNARPTLQRSFSAQARDVNAHAHTPGARESRASCRPSRYMQPPHSGCCSHVARGGIPPAQGVDVHTQVVAHQHQLVDGPRARKANLLPAPGRCVYMCMCVCVRARAHVRVCM